MTMTMTMTNRQLIEKLSELDLDAEINLCQFHESIKNPIILFDIDSIDLDDQTGGISLVNITLIKSK